MGFHANDNDTRKRIHSMHKTMANDPNISKEQFQDNNFFQ